MARRFNSDGVHSEDTSSTVLKVSGSGAASVTVAPGMATVNGFFYHLDATKTLAVPANLGGSARIDLVVLRADQSANAVTAAYKTGGTTAPTLTQVEDGVWEIPLAQCTVAAGSTVVTAANVADRRYFTSRGILPSLSGARPPSVKNTLMVEGTDVYVGDGVDWKWLASVGIKDFTYTPIWYAETTLINWGSGPDFMNIGRVQVVNKRVDLTIQLIPTGNPASVNAPLQVSLPPGLPSNSSLRGLFKWTFTSSNGEGSAVGIGMIFPTESTTRIARLRYPTSAGNSISDPINSQSLFNNRPFDIRSGDVLTIDGSYWLA
ncbi:hypothetical protein ACF1GW_38910 [Streptomyces achromogenes]|uniref:hypothetical protein n=1 Tax=Streptomyces achromogenes TaxID=67255 RepID=UPI0036FFF6BF